MATIFCFFNKEVSSGGCDSSTNCCSSDTVCRFNITFRSILKRKNHTFATAKACIKRLHALEDDSLVSAIASQPTDVAKQICLYALIKQSRLVWEFMLTVIGEKYRLRDTSFGKIDLNTFFMRLQEQNDTVASWSDTTITKLKQIIARVLVETEYLDNLKADHLNPVWLHPVLENAIRSNGDMAILPAFNCFV